jgi:hypothetical protein
MKRYFLRSLPAVLAFMSVSSLVAQVQPLHDVAVPVNTPVDISIPENFAPFGNRPDTDKAGDDGSFVVRDRNGAMIWITRDGATNLLPDSTLGKALYVSNSECVVFENRYQATPVRYDTPKFSSVVAIHRLNEDGSITSRRASFDSQTLIDTVPVTPTTYGYTLATAKYTNENEQESIANYGTSNETPFDLWGEGTYTIYRLTWESVTADGVLDVQLLFSDEYYVEKLNNEETGSVLADTRILAFGSDGSFLFNRTVGRGPYTDLGTRTSSFLVTFNVGVETITRLNGPDDLPITDVVYIDNNRLIAAARIPLETPPPLEDFFGNPIYLPSENLELFEYRTRLNGSTDRTTYELEDGERPINTGLYHRRGFPDVFFTVSADLREIRLNDIGSGLTRLDSVAMPAAIQPDNPAIRNARDSSLLVQSDGSFGTFWITTTTDADGFPTGIEAVRSVPTSTQASPLYVSQDEAVLWMNGDAPVDLSAGAQIPLADVRHVSKNGTDVSLTSLQIDGRYITKPPGLSNDPLTEGWILTTFEKLLSTSRTARLRTYRLHVSDTADSDADGISDEEERFIYFTDPDDADTDDDGLSDGQEIRPFELILGNFTWQEARKDAKARGGRLAVLNTTAKQTGMKFITGNRIRALADAAWIGGSDLTVEGQYRWVTSSGGVKGPLLPADPDDASNNWKRPFHPNNRDDADGMAVAPNSSLSWVMYPAERKFPYLIEYVAADPLNPDVDGDGLTDGEERTIGSDPTQLDTDGDGLSDLQERQAGSNPSLIDTDGDGLNDFEEVRTYRTNPTMVDTDNDQLEDGAEITRGTNPRKRDTDGDGVIDGVEVAAKTNPLNIDTDSDGLDDGQEAKLGTNPLKADTDGDGIKDNDEVSKGSDPLDPKDPKEIDTDGDGLTNYDELFIYGTNPDKRDTDGDGLSDFEEVQLASNPQQKDTDRDGIPDGVEVNVTFTNPNDPSTGHSVSQGTIPFGSSSVQGEYEGIVVSAKGVQTFKQTLRVSSGGSFSAKLFGLRSNTSFAGTFTKDGVYQQKLGSESDLKSVRMLVVNQSGNVYTIQGTYDSRQGGEFYFQLRKVVASKSAGTQKVTFDTTYGKGKGPSGALVGTGMITNRSHLALNLYMPDGSRSSFSGPILREGLISFYSRSGDASSAVVTGMLKLRDVKKSSDFDGAVRLFSASNRSGSFYPSGYDQQRSLMGSYYRSPAAGTLPLSGFRVRSNNVALQWLGGDFQGVKKAGTWTSDGRFVIPTGQNDSASTSFQNETGLFKMTYRRTDSDRGLADANAYAMAVAQQKKDSFRGYYISDGSTARFDIVPNQGSVQPDITSVSPKSKMVSAASQSYTVTVKTTGAWTVEIPLDAPWVTAVVNSSAGSGPSDETDATGDGTVVFTVATNALYARRKAIIRIAGIDHELTQEFR